MIFDDKAKIMADERAYLEPKDINKIINQASKPRDKLLLMTLANTGRRISEALSLKPRDIDFNKELIYWRVLKRRDTNRLWIATNRNLLLSYKQYINTRYIEPDEYVFKSSHKKEQPLTRRRADQIVKKIGKKAGIKKVGEGLLHCHTFRHSFAIYLARQIKRASDLVLLQQLLGHAKIATTAYYLRFAQIEAKELVNTFPDFLGLGLKKEEVIEQLKEPSPEFDIRSISNDVITEL